MLINPIWGHHHCSPRLAVTLLVVGYDVGCGGMRVVMCGGEREGGDMRGCGRAGVIDARLCVNCALCRPMQGQSKRGSNVLQNWERSAMLFEEVRALTLPQEHCTAIHSRACDVSSAQRRGCVYWCGSMPSAKGYNTKTQCVCCCAVVPEPNACHQRKFANQAGYGSCRSLGQTARSAACL